MLRVTPLTHPSLIQGNLKEKWEKIFHLLVCTGQEKCRLNVLAEGENSSSPKFIFWLFLFSFLARLMCLLGLKQQRLIWKSVLCFCFLYLYTYGTVFVLARKSGKGFFFKGRLNIMIRIDVRDVYSWWGCRLIGLVTRLLIGAIISGLAN
jgi:hypothetical protein